VLVSRLACGPGKVFTLSEQESNKKHKSRHGKGEKKKPQEINWRAWYLGGVLFFISIPLGLYLWNPFTGVQRVRNRVAAIKGRAEVEVVAPGILQAIFGSDVGFWSQIAGGTQVMRLHLDQSKVSDEDLRILRSTPFLTSLHLSNTAISDAGLKYLKYATELKELLLVNTAAVTDKGLEELPHLKNLERINLTGTQVTEEIAETLKSVHSLKEVTLGGPKITPEGIEKVRAALPGIEVHPKPGGATPAPPAPVPSKPMG